MLGRSAIFASAVVLSAVTITNAADFDQYDRYPPQPYYRAAPVYPPVVEPQPYYPPRAIVIPIPQPQLFFPFFHFGAPEPVYPAQPVYPTQSIPHPQYSSRNLTQKCAMASEYIRNNNCGPRGCDEGYCVAIQNGCHINSWGHTCNWKNR